MTAEAQGWIGVDLDGTLATYDHWRGEQHIGEPIPLMVDRAKKWLAEGKQVRIFTARACGANRQEVVLPAIEQWCLKHIGQVLPVTNQKDYEMQELWDDRCVQVEPNTGRKMDRNEVQIGALPKASRNAFDLSCEIMDVKNRADSIGQFPRPFLVTMDEFQLLCNMYHAALPATSPLFKGPRVSGVLGTYDGVLLVQKL